MPPTGLPSLVDALAVAFDPAADQVQAQVGQLQRGFLRCAAATAQQAAHPGQQFGKGEGLDQVIVGAQFQAVYTVFHGITGSEEQHRDVEAGAAHGLQDLPAVAAGQHHVEDQQVVITGQRQVLPGSAVGHQFGGKASLGQALAQVMAGFWLVFDDQQFHGRLLAAGSNGLYTVGARAGAQPDKVVI